MAALGFENRRLGLGNRRLGLSVVDIDAAMRRQCTHLNSQARGDILVRTADLEITDKAQGYGSSRKQFVIDVKPVRGYGERHHTIMRLTGTPSFPVVAPVSRQHLAHDNPGVSDFRDLRQAPRVASLPIFPPLPPF